MDKNLIQINNLKFGFRPDIELISNLTWNLYYNQVVSIIGNSGCGKSTFLNLITGLLQPNSGSIILRETFSYLTQSPTLLPYRNSLENSLLASELRNTLHNDKIQQASLLFKHFNLSESTKSKFPSELSGGMKQRIGLIQTLMIEAKLFIFDEPFNAIDRATTYKIQNYIWELIKTKMNSGIIVTHDLEQSILISDKIYIMSNASTLDEINFVKEFTLLPPQERKKSKYYEIYLIQLIKKLNEENN